MQRDGGQLVPVGPPRRFEVDLGEADRDRGLTCVSFLILGDTNRQVTSYGLLFGLGP